MQIPAKAGRGQVLLGEHAESAQRGTTGGSHLDSDSDNIKMRIVQRVCRDEEAQDKKEE